MKIIFSIFSFLLFIQSNHATAEDLPRTAANQMPSVEAQENLSSFLERVAPVLVIPNYRPAIDKPIQLDHVQSGVFDAQQSASAALKSADALVSANSSNNTAVVYYDYFEAAGMLSAAFTFYRPLDDKPGDRHAHDAGSAVLSFLKSGDTDYALENPAILDAAEFVALVANSHGDPLMSVPSEKYSSKLVPNFSQRKVWLRSVHEDLIRSQGESQVLDMGLGRAAIASVSKIHSLVGISDVSAIKDFCDSDERVAAFIPVDDPELRASIEKAIPCVEVEVYALEMLAPVIHEHSDTLLAKKKKNGDDAYTTRCQFDPSMEDAYGNSLTVCSYPTEMKNEDGVAGGANAHFGWGMVTRFDESGRALSLDRGDGKKASQRTDWSNYHEIVRYVFRDFLPEGLSPEDASVLYFNMYTEL
jgi:hypothetical protein